MDLAECLQPLVTRNEMQYQQAGGAVEWPIRSSVDVTLMKVDARNVRPRDLSRHPEHMGRYGSIPSNVQPE